MVNKAYYNEIDPYCAAWLRNLIDAGHIARGDVDERSIIEIRADDLRGYTQCHFFAGIGGWSYALRLAGWDDTRFVWTGSCPCQPLSVAGKGLGTRDERHLWPEWFKLIAECRPVRIFGEQVASKDGLAWFDIVSTDLETESYAIGAVDLCAAGVGAPHIRQRLWFVADADSNRRQVRRIGQDGLAALPGQEGDQTQRSCRSSWADLEWLPCLDGKARPVESSTFPLAHGIPGRVGRLRAYGNAIVPQAAVEFIRAVTWR